MSLIKEYLQKGVLHCKYFRFFVATVFFILAIGTNSILEFIIYILYFIIFIELTNITAELIIRKHIKMRYIIDTFIVISLRELIVSVSKMSSSQPNYSDIFTFIQQAQNLNVMVYSGVILFLFLIKYITLKLTILKIKGGLQDDD